MAIVDQINQDLSAAMKEANVARTSVLRLIKNSLHNEQIKLGHELSEEEAIKVIQREAKQRKDSIEQYQSGGREDLVASEQVELEVLQAYLPQPMSQAELEALVDSVIAETGATGMAQMGMVIGKVIQQAGAKADGGAVSQLVRQRLS